MVAYGFNTKVMVSVSSKDSATLFSYKLHPIRRPCLLFVSCTFLQGGFTRTSAEDKHKLACGTVNMRELNQLFDVGSGNIFSSLNVIKGLRAYRRLPHFVRIFKCFTHERFL